LISAGEVRGVAFSGGAGVQRALRLSLFVLCGMRTETAEIALYRIPAEAKGGSAI
jgi:hypothetical protein